MKKILHVFLSLLLSTMAVHAQTRQMLFSDTTGGTMTFYDSKIDNDGFVVTVGGFYNQGDDYGFVMKTDKKGNLIWKQRSLASPLSKVKIAANGDYLITSGGKNLMVILRIAPNGSTVWTSYTAFWSNRSLSTTGITELANGDIAICGTNSFGYWNPNAYYFDGWLQLFSGVDGTSKWQKAFVSPTERGMFHFTGMTSKNNTLIIGGHYAPPLLNPVNRNFILQADTFGNLVSIKYYDSSTASNGKTLAMDGWTFRDMAVKNGKIFVSGVYRENPGNKEVLHVSVYDETTDSISGHVYNLAAANLNGGRADITDSNECFLAMNPDTAWTITARIVNDTPRFVKAFRSNNKIVRGVTGLGDTMILAGTIKGQAMYGWISRNSATENGCTVLDSALVVTTYGSKLTTGVIPDVFTESLSSDYNLPTKLDTTLQKTFVCAPPVNGGISELLSGKLKIYPNPNNGIFMIEGISTDKNTAVHVTNIYGQTIQASQTVTSSKISIKLDVPAGVYYITVSTATGKQTEKIVVR